MTYCLENLFLLWWFGIVDHVANEYVPAEDWQKLIERTRLIARENAWTEQQTDEFLERLAGFLERRKTASPVVCELLRLESQPVNTTR